MLNSRNAYLLGYAWGTIDKAMGGAYDKSGEKFDSARQDAYMAFFEINEAAFEAHVLTEPIKDIIGDCFWEIGMEQLADREPLDAERIAMWQLGVYHARSGKPLAAAEFDISTSRKARKMTQQQLADAMGVDQALVSRWESGKVSPNKDNLAKLKEILQ